MLQLRPASFVSFAIKIPSRPAAFCILKISAMGLVLMLFVCPSLLAYQLTLEWDPNAEQDLAGYIVYYGTASRNYRYSVDIGDETSCTISNLYSGVTYFFAVTAYDIEGNESDYSEEISYPNSGGAGESGATGSLRGGGGGGCFISVAADGKNSVYGLKIIVGLVLTTFTGCLMYRRYRCKKPNQNLQ